jgi:glycosyltransferase involved in cell wall biosynthesis
MARIQFEPNIVSAQFSEIDFNRSALTSCPDGENLSLPEVTRMEALQPSAATLCIQHKELGSWLQVISHVSPRYGGIATSVPELARATEAESSHTCPIVGFCEETELEHIGSDQRSGLEVLPPSRVRWMMDPRLWRRLCDTIRSCNGVHIHGIWGVHCMAAAEMARSSKRPYMISAHGMLEQWALDHKRFKKALYAALVEKRRLQRAACLRALSADEVDDYRRLGLTNPIAIVPNSVDPPINPRADRFWDAYPELSGKRIVLFLGRLHPKKGLPLLLQAWSRKARMAEDIHLVIAGPDSENTRALLETMTGELNLSSSVTFTGMLTDERKWSALAAASLFVLPSYSEGFSVALLEALAIGVPAIVTTPCHIPEVLIHGCGWVVPPESGRIEGALNEFLSLSLDEAALLGERGRRLARQRFHPSVVGKQMAQVYDWLQGAVLPSDVEIA